MTLTERGIGLNLLTGKEAAVDTTASGKLVFGMFAALAEFERTIAGLTAARPWPDGRTPVQDDSAKLRLAMASMGRPGPKSATSVPNSASPGRPCTGMYHPPGNSAGTEHGGKCVGAAEHQPDRV